MFELILRTVRELPPESVILLRRPRNGDPGFVEAVTAGMLKSDHGLPRFAVEWFSPEPGGRDQTYRRDFELVSEADEVLALFDPDHVMEGGTGHVVEAALLRQVPVTAWAIHPDGRFERVGELDGV